MKYFFTILFLIVFLQQSNSQTDNSLLWEITGNGLEKPSFLYGTMHVSSKVAFRLDDVFFKSLEKADAIALESDPTQWMDEYYSEQVLTVQNESVSYDATFYDDLFKLEHPQPQMVRASIRMNDMALNGYLYRKNGASDNFEEETYLDMFIFQAGKKAGKPIISLEDFKESQYLTSKAATNPSKKEIDQWLQERLEKENRYTIQENVYRDRNISLLDSIGAATNTEYFRKNMLYDRNENMVVVMDSVMKTQTVFAGVGAAHLPGENGMIKMLQRRGYTVKALTSAQTELAKTEKKFLDENFVAPTLSRKRTPDQFLSLKSFDDLREFSIGNQSFYMMPEMTNGAYLTISRINTLDYLSTDKKRIDLDFIDNVLFEDIPGDIIEKKKLTTPYPGYSILNKTKKGDYQKYHIYKTPLELIVIKFGGKLDFVKQYEQEIFSSIEFLPNSKILKTFTAPFNKYKLLFPEHVAANNLENPGKTFLQGTDGTSFYFFQESPVFDTDYIEEDQFEAEFIVDEFLEDLGYKKMTGKFEKDPYDSYQATAIMDTVQNKKLSVKAIVKDGSYYLMGYTGVNPKKGSLFFNSIKFHDIDYGKFETVQDTAMHFSVYSPVKAPLSRSRYSYNDIKEYQSRENAAYYTTPANEQIEVKMTKFHDLQMFHNPKDLWKDVDSEDWIDMKLYRSSTRAKEKEQTEKDGLFTYKRIFKDSLSAKHILAKSVYFKGRIYHLKTIVDSTQQPSQFVTQFYNSFTPQDTMLGKDIFTDKTALFFKGVQQKDTLVFEAGNKVKFRVKDIPQMIALIVAVNVEDNSLKSIKEYTLNELIDLKDERVLPYITNLYESSYNDPDVQLLILRKLLRKKTAGNHEKVLRLLEKDLPLKKSGISSAFNRYGDSLKLSSKLFPELLTYASISEYKEPVYELLARTKDSGFVKKKTYKKYRKQIITDGKIEIKRTLSAKRSSYDYKSNDLLNSYVKLIFPFRKDRNAQDFFIKLLDSGKNEAVAEYVTLLMENDEIIPQKIKKEIEKDLSLKAQIMITAAEREIKLSPVTSQEDLARSIVLTASSFDQGEDELSFEEKKIITTDKGKKAALYIFYFKNKGSYHDQKYIRYVAFELDDKKAVITEPYDKSYGNGKAYDTDKEKADALKEIVKTIKHKGRRRVN
ncbi:TraB/GumN family protein [Nonlabens sp. Ci31]|uniref:TraB/GumN family protein n=1 Tax=Nonlabens sp. Ci31 TaxID=2608253 RepID=UPI0014646CFE|nr:TraB/GumN family protein [Nonlabens sp. Ci31]QJP33835.1 TraB/GumN family protein [Nonlabens sp. Ci31]